MRNTTRRFYLRWILPLVVLLALVTIALLSPLAFSAHAKGSVSTLPGSAVPSAWWLGP